MSGCKKFYTVLGFVIIFLSLQQELWSQNFWEQIPFSDSALIFTAKVNIEGDIFLAVQNSWTLPSPQGIFRSTDHGASWQNVSPSGVSIGGNCRGLDIDSYGNIFTWRSETIFKSGNNGLSWIPIYSDIDHNFFINTIKSGFDSVILVGGYGQHGILRSGDYGATWSIVYSLPISSWQSFTDFLYDPTGKIYACSVHPESGYQSLLESNDVGKTWNPILSSQYVGGLNALALDNQGNLLLGSQGHGLCRLNLSTHEYSYLTPSTTVTGILVSTDDKYYLATNDETYPGHGGCLIYDNSNNSFIQQNSGLSDRFCKGIITDESGHLLIFGDWLHRSVESIITDVRIYQWNSDFSFRCFPNPAYEYVIIDQCNGFCLFSKMHITIYDITGKKHLDENKKIKFPLRIDLAAYPTGLFFVNIESGSQQFSVRFLHSKTRNP
jgi:hypothetical protein